MSSHPLQQSAERLSVESAVVDFILLDERLEPGINLEETWLEAITNEDLQPLIHGALVFISDHYAGTEPEAIGKALGFRDGVAFTLRSLMQTIKAAKEERELQAIIDSGGVDVSQLPAGELPADPPAPEPYPKLPGL